MTLTPLGLAILIECRVSGSPGSNIPQSIWESAAAIDQRSQLLSMGVIDKELSVTARGRIWLDAMLETPLPKPYWVIPERPKIFFEE